MELAAGVDAVSGTSRSTHRGRRCLGSSNLLSVPHCQEIFDGQCGGTVGGQRWRGRRTSTAWRRQSSNHDDCLFVGRNTAAETWWRREWIRVGSDHSGAVQISLERLHAYCRGRRRTVIISLTPQRVRRLKGSPVTRWSSWRSIMDQVFWTNLFKDDDEQLVTWCYSRRLI